MAIEHEAAGRPDIDEVDRRAVALRIDEPIAVGQERRERRDVDHAAGANSGQVDRALQAIIAAAGRS